jgi:hypothetical protein
MIFLSHNYHDKPFVDLIANQLANVFGREKVFYDAWSIQPGDSLIGKMSEGLAQCSFFFFVVTKNSLQSKMVTLEWQNALMKSVAGGCRFIPIKADDCVMPAILLQNLYIDLSNYGLDAAIGQMVDVISGKSTYRPSPGFSNLRATSSGDGKKTVVRVEAGYFLEPIARFLILVKNKEGEINPTITGESMTLNGFAANVRLNDGQVFNAISIGAVRGITPRHPMDIVLEATGSSMIDFVGVMHQTSTDQYQGIPLTKGPRI